MPIAIAVRDDIPCGRGINQSPFNFARSAKQPMCVSPTPQPLRINASPAFQSGWVDAMTSPAPSIPGTIGHLRTTGDLPVIANPSL